MKGVPSHLKPDAITNQRSSSGKPCFARNCSVLVRDWQKWNWPLDDNAVGVKCNLRFIQKPILTNAISTQQSRKNNLTMVEKSHLRYQNISFLNIQFRRLMISWKWLGLSLFSKGNIEQLEKLVTQKLFLWHSD
jgi:hypothetical protein